MKLCGHPILQHIRNLIGSNRVWNLFVNSNNFNKQTFWINNDKLEQNQTFCFCFFQKNPSLLLWRNSDKWCTKLKRQFTSTNTNLPTNKTKPIHKKSFLILPSNIFFASKRDGGCYNKKNININYFYSHLF
jgi:hypothetical protein